MRSKGTKTIAENRKARHDYFVLEAYEAGIELVGTEVKSIRQGGVNLKDSWCSIDKGELFVRGMHISPYEKGNIFNRDPMRVRKLLMHKREINKLYGTLKQEGLSLIPCKQGSRCPDTTQSCQPQPLQNLCLSTNLCRSQRYYGSNIRSHQAL